MENNCDSKRDSWPWILAPSLTIFTTTWPWAVYVVCLNSWLCSHTQHGLPNWKNNPLSDLLRGLLKLCEERSWSCDLCMVSSIFAQLCPLINVLGESDSVRHVNTSRSGTTGLLSAHLPQHPESAWAPEARQQGDEKQGSLAPKSPGEAPDATAFCYVDLGVSVTWFYHLSSRVIIVLVSWRCYEVYIRVWPQ